MNNNDSIKEKNSIVGEKKDTTWPKFKTEHAETLNKSYGWVTILFGVLLILISLWSFFIAMVVSYIPLFHIPIVIVGILCLYSGQQIFDHEYKRSTTILSIAYLTIIGEGIITLWIGYTSFEITFCGSAIIFPLTLLAISIFLYRSQKHGETQK